jgi:hypothetical protein
MSVSFEDKLIGYIGGDDHKLDDLVTILCKEAQTVKPTAKTAHDLSKIIRHTQLCPHDNDSLTSINNIDYILANTCGKRNYLLIELQHMLHKGKNSFDLLFRKSVENWQNNGSILLQKYKDNGLALFNSTYGPLVF